MKVVLADCITSGRKIVLNVYGPIFKRVVRLISHDHFAVQSDIAI